VHQTHLGHKEVDQPLHSTVHQAQLGHKELEQPLHGAAHQTQLEHKRWKSHYTVQCTKHSTLKHWFSISTIGGTPSYSFSSSADTSGGVKGKKRSGPIKLHNSPLGIELILSRLKYDPKSREIMWPGNNIWSRDSLKIQNLQHMCPSSHLMKLYPWVLVSDKLV